MRNDERLPLGIDLIEAHFLSRQQSNQIHAGSFFKPWIFLPEALLFALPLTEQLTTFCFSGNV